MKNTLYVIAIPRLEVESKDIGTITHYIKQLEKIKAPSQCVEVTFSGFDETTDEIYEIKEIREFVTKVLKQAPEILYYTSFSTGATTRLLSCVYDVESVIQQRMTAHEASEYAMKHGDLQQHPVIITIPDDELSMLYAAIKGYGIKRKNLFGAGEIVRELKRVFGG